MLPRRREGFQANAQCLSDLEELSHPKGPSEGRSVRRRQAKAMVAETTADAIPCVLPATITPTFALDDIRQRA